MAGHGSYLTDQFPASCLAACVFVVLFPAAHFSRITQPLDVVCFAPLKQVYCAMLAVLEKINLVKAETKKTLLDYQLRVPAKGVFSL